MLTKLLKYDLKYMIKNMTVFYVLSILFSIMSRIFLSFNQTIMMNIISKICIGCMFSMTASILINTIMRSWVRFRDSLYKDEAYLTHTLPVTKSNIYNSKLIQTLIFFIISFLIIVICLFITYYTKDRWILLKEYVNTNLISSNLKISFILISTIVILFLELFNMIQCGFLGIILGHKNNNNKIVLSVTYGFISYLISQSIVIILFILSSLFNKDILSLFKNTTIIDYNIFKPIIIISIIIYIVIIITMSYINKWILQKGVNVE